jgi:hypothetical protein
VKWLERLKQALGPGEPPVAEFHDPILGPLKWNEDDEGWEGKWNGIRCTLSYTRDSGTPSEEVLQYARELISNEAILRDGLEAAKSQAMQEYPASLHAEIAALRYEWLAFDSGKGRRYLFATLGPEVAGRLWRVEFEGTQCSGMGCDT